MFKHFENGATPRPLPPHGPPARTKSTFSLLQTKQENYVQNDDDKSDLSRETSETRTPENLEPVVREILIKESFGKSLKLACKQIGGNFVEEKRKRKIECKEPKPSHVRTATLTIPAPPLGPTLLAINAAASTRPPPHKQACSAAISLSPTNQSELRQGQLHSRANSDWSAPLTSKPLDNKN